MRSSRFVIVVLMLLSASEAYASTEINGLFDGRSAGMGGTGVAFLDSAGAIPTNPALLDQIGKLTISLDAFAIFAQPEAPYTIWHLDAMGQHYQTYETVRSDRTGAVLPFLGGAYRLFDRVVLGIGVYPVIGQGTAAKYRPAPDELPNVIATNQASMGLVEAAEAVSVRLLDNLSLGVMWRVTYMIQSVSTPVPTGGAPAGVLLNAMRTEAVNADIDVTGINFTGLQVGLLYKVVPSLRLGFTYRNKVVVDGTGTTTTHLGATPIKLDTQSGFTNPHMFRAGLAWTTLNDKLLLAADFKYIMYAEAFKELKTVTVMNGKENVKYQPAYWKDAYNVQLGAEYKAGDTFRFRAGYIMATSATPEKYALAFMAPPGVSHLVGAGLGIAALDNLDVDLAAAYVVLQSRINTATPYNAGVGLYASHAGEFSLSATFHM
jgi:long-subunit fatty acid transport protein